MNWWRMAQFVRAPRIELHNKRLNAWRMSGDSKRQFGISPGRRWLLKAPMSAIKAASVNAGQKRAAKPEDIHAIFD